jgi:hypothetical protein
VIGRYDTIRFACKTVRWKRYARTDGRLRPNTRAGGCLILVSHGSGCIFDQRAPEVRLSTPGDRFRPHRRRVVHAPRKQFGSFPLVGSNKRQLQTGRTSVWSFPQKYASHGWCWFRPGPLIAVRSGYRDVKAGCPQSPRIDELRGFQPGLKLDADSHTARIGVKAASVGGLIRFFKFRSLHQRYAANSAPPPLCTGFFVWANQNVPAAGLVDTAAFCQDQERIGGRAPA